MIRIPLNVKSEGTKKIEVFSQGTGDSNNLRCETLYIADYEYISITSFTVLDIDQFPKRHGLVHNGGFPKFESPY